MIIQTANRLIHSPGRLSELIRFVAVGGIATAIQYVAYLLCISSDAMSPQWATVVSYCISLVFNFILSNFFTFKTRPNRKKALGFVMSHMVNMGLQIILVSLFTHLVGEKWALLPAMAICVPVNYLLVRLSLTGKVGNKK